eukprot:13498243-Alexandrium_andersonii.AAC.3
MDSLLVESASVAPRGGGHSAAWAECNARFSHHSGRDSADGARVCISGHAGARGVLIDLHTPTGA